MDSARALLVHDEGPEGEAVEGLLVDARWTVTRVETADQALRVVELGGADVVVSAFDPRRRPLEMLAAMRARRPYMPVLFVSDVAGEEHPVQALRAGAADYLMRRDLARLLPALDRERAMAHANRARARIEADRDAHGQWCRHVIEASPDAILVVD